MKTILIIVMLFISCSTVYSQDSSLDFLLQDTVKHDVDRYIDNFLGSWMAIDGDDVYEVTFVKRVLYHDMINKYSIAVLGSIKKMRDNKIVYYREIRETNVITNGAFPLFGGPISSNSLSMFYIEPGENKELGKVTFTMSEDGQTGTWVLRGTVHLKIINLQKYERFEIPYKMTFKRKKEENFNAKRSPK